jgi:hypothetical protein
MFQETFLVNTEILSLFAGFKEFVKLVLRTSPPKTHPKTEKEGWIGGRQGIER